MSLGRTLHAPDDDGAIVAEPPLREIGALLEENRRRLQRAGLFFHGRDWTWLQQQARKQVIEAAKKYLQQFGEPLPDAASESIIMAGHQPELFHPGVWVKNFAIYGQARTHGLTPINLIVDNDTLKSTSLRVPLRREAHFVSVPFDRWQGEAPWERRTVADPEVFAFFPKRVAELMRDWHYEPLLPSYWADVSRLNREHPLLGDCFAAARRAQEHRWGCYNLEVPVSAVCRTEAFAYFASQLIANLPRFHALYNQVVATYRRAHGIRSRSHPVPDLGADGDWLETPFWGARSTEVQRGRLFARCTSGSVELRVGTQSWPSLPADDLTGAWSHLEQEGYCVRSRALTNTLFARLFLADLFVHGIGGGKYDELTDEIMRRFYDLDPPHYLVLSGTRLLPLPLTWVSNADCQRLTRAVRDVYWNPQRHLPDESSWQVLRAEKQAWIEVIPTDTRERHERFEKLRELTVKLREPLVRRESELQAELATCKRQLEVNAALRRRDYSFVLYPEALLREFCTQFI